jgi:hypothetical protein
MGRPSSSTPVPAPDMLTMGAKDPVMPRALVAGVNAVEDPAGRCLACMLPQGLRRDSMAKDCGITSMDFIRSEIDRGNGDATFLAFGWDSVVWAASEELRFWATNRPLMRRRRAGGSRACSISAVAIGDAMDSMARRI